MFSAIVSAIAAALTAILAKVGAEGVPRTLATAIRTLIASAPAQMVLHSGVNQ